MLMPRPTPRRPVMGKTTWEFPKIRGYQRVPLKGYYKGTIRVTLKGSIRV